MSFGKTFSHREHRENQLDNLVLTFHTVGEAESYEYLRHLCVLCGLN